MPPAEIGTDPAAPGRQGSCAPRHPAPPVPRTRLLRPPRPRRQIQRSPLTPPAALAGTALPPPPAGPSCRAERRLPCVKGRRPRGRLRAGCEGQQRGPGAAASLRSPRCCGRRRRRGPSSGACSRPPGPTQRGGDAQRPGRRRAPSAGRGGRGPLSRPPCAALPQSPLPRRRPGTPARPRPGRPPELATPPRPRPPPCLPLPLPHVGRAATAAAAAAATISGPLPLPLSLTDSRPRRPSPSRSAHARPAHAAAGPGHAHGARAGLARLQGGGGAGALRLRPQSSARRPGQRGTLAACRGRCWAAGSAGTAERRGSARAVFLPALASKPAGGKPVGPAS